MRARLRRWGGLLGVVLLATAVPVATRTASAGLEDCSADYLVDEVLANGARWQLCWEPRAYKGVILHNVTYTPIGGQPVEVLYEAYLAQIHVPYDDNGARFHDVSDYGLGTNFATLTAADCPNGTLVDDAGEDILCQTEAPTGYAAKDYDHVRQGTSLNLFSTSCIGAYCYVVSWSFDDDGTIRPEVGATGSLQRYGGNNRTGWQTGPDHPAFGGPVAVAHLHNYYWKLDFDVDGTANDRVEELEAGFAPGTNRTRLRNTRRQLANEAARRVSPTTFRSWRVRDTVTRNDENHPISWELVPSTDHIFRGPERFTQNEVYVTTQNACEDFASHNPTTGGCGAHAAAFVNGQAVSDPVIWYGTSFHHLPRDEDEEHMHPHWSGFSIVPRDLTADNPAD